MAAFRCGTGQPPPVEPLVVVWDGAGLGVGGCGGGLTDGLGVGVLAECAGARDEPAALGDAVRVALSACPVLAVGDGFTVARAAASACEAGP